MRDLLSAAASADEYRNAFCTGNRDFAVGVARGCDLLVAGSFEAVSALSCVDDFLQIIGRAADFRALERARARKPRQEGNPDAQK